MLKNRGVFLLIWVWMLTAPSVLMVESMAAKKKSSKPAKSKTGDADKKSPPAVAPPECKPITAAKKLNWPKTNSLSDLVAWAGGYSCATIIFPGGDKPNSGASNPSASLVASDKYYTPQQTWNIFLALLDVSGYYLVKNGPSVYQVIDTNRAPTVGGDFVGIGQQAGDTSQYKTQLFDLKAIPLNGIRELVSGVLGASAKFQLTPLGTQAPFLVASGPARLLTALYDALQSLKKMNAGSGDFHLIPLSSSNAAEIVTYLNESNQNDSLGISKIAYIKDAGVLIYRGGSADVEQSIKKLTKQLAKRTFNRTQQGLYQVTLLHTIPKEMKTYIDGLKGSSGASCAVGILETKSTIGINCSDNLAISNTWLRAILDKDIPQPKVYFKFALMDASAENTREVGVGWGGSTSAAGGTVIGSNEVYGTGAQTSTYANPLNIASMAALAGTNAGFFGPVLTSGILAGFAPFNITVHLLARNNAETVKQQPSLTCTVGTKCIITDGKNLPMPGSSAVTPGTGQSTIYPIVTVSREDFAVSIDANVTNISRRTDGTYTVYAEIKAEVSDVGNPNYNNLGPEKKTKKFTFTLSQQTGSTVVTGGLCSERETEVVTKTPILGDIPILGYLFKSKSKVRAKKCQSLAVTSTVITTALDEALLTQEMAAAIQFVSQAPSITRFIEPTKGGVQGFIDTLAASSKDAGVKRRQQLQQDED